MKINILLFCFAIMNMAYTPSGLANEFAGTDNRYESVEYSSEDYNVLKINLSRYSAYHRSRRTDTYYAIRFDNTDDSLFAKALLEDPNRSFVWKTKGTSTFDPKVELEIRHVSAWTLIIEGNEISLQAYLDSLKDEAHQFDLPLDNSGDISGNHMFYHYDIENRQRLNHGFSLLRSEFIDEGNGYDYRLLKLYLADAGHVRILSIQFHGVKLAAFGKRLLDDNSLNYKWYYDSTRVNQTTHLQQICYCSMKIDIAGNIFSVRDLQRIYERQQSSILVNADAVQIEAFDGTWGNALRIFVRNDLFCETSFFLWHWQLKTVEWFFQNKVAAALWANRKIRLYDSLSHNTVLSLLEIEGEPPLDPNNYFSNALTLNPAHMDFLIREAITFLFDDCLVFYYNDMMVSQTCSDAQTLRTTRITLIQMIEDAKKTNQRIMYFPAEFLGNEKTFIDGFSLQK